jgi:transcriptional regulator with XRE-family HTH domain
LPTFADWLRSIITERGMSAGELARRVGVRRWTVQDWLHGRGTPIPENCEKLAAVLQMSPQEVKDLAGWH